MIDEALRELTARPPAAILYVYFANGTPVLTPRAYLAPVLDWIARRYRIEQVFPNRVVMLTPRRPDDTAKEECRVRSVLYADFPGWEITAEVVARRIERACP